MEGDDGARLFDPRPEGVEVRVPGRAAALGAGERAEELVRSAISRSQDSEPAYLDTLAAALAEQGRFAEAIEAESELLRRLEKKGAPAAVLAQLREHLRRFQAGAAIRDPAESAP